MSERSKILEKIHEEVARSFEERKNEAAAVKRPEKLLYIRA
jgi:hypothetical protein